MPRVGFSNSKFSVVEGKEGRLALFRTGNLQFSSTVSISIVGGTAIPVGGEADYDSSPFPFTVTFGANEDNILIPVSTIDDSLIEDIETVRFELSSVDGQTEIFPDAKTATLEILDSESIVQFESATFEIEEGEGKIGKLILKRTGNLDVESKVTINRISGTATSDKDYTDNGFPTTFTFQAGKDEIQILIPILDDDKIEGTENIDFEVVVAGDDSGQTQIGTQNKTTLNIVDDELPVIEITPISVDHPEGDDSQTEYIFTISADKDLTEPITVSYETEDGSAVSSEDYNDEQGDITLSNANKSQDISIFVTGDKKYEEDEQFKVNISLKPEDEDTKAYLGNSQAIAVISNDDEKPPTAIISTTDEMDQISRTTTVTEGNAPDGTPERTPVPLYIKLDPELEEGEEPVTVTYTSQNGTATATEDYTKAEGSVTFNVGEGETYKLIDPGVEVLGDDESESNEEFFVTLKESNDNSYTLPNQIGKEVEVIIQDDDEVPTVSIETVSTTSVEEGEEIEFVLKLTEAATEDVTVTLNNTGSATENADYTLASKTYVIPAGEPGEEPFSISTIDDELAGEGVETIKLKIIQADKAEIGAGEVQVTIEDNDDPIPPLQAWIESPGEFVTEGDAGSSNSLDFEIKLSREFTEEEKQAGKTVAIEYYTSSGVAIGGLSSPADYVYMSDEVVFVDETSKTVSIPIIGDKKGEPTLFENFFVKISSNDVEIIPEAKEAQGWIEDDDEPPPEMFIEPISSSVTEGEDSTYDFRIRLSREVEEGEAPIVVTYKTEDGSAKQGEDYIAVSQQIAFLAGEDEKEIFIDIEDDNNYEEPEDFKVKIESNDAKPGITEAEGIILDDDPFIFLSPLNISQQEGDEGQTTYTFTANLSKPVDREISVRYSTESQASTGTLNDPATPGVDYVPVQNQLITFAPNTTSQTIEIQVNGDEDVENNEEFLLKLHDPVNAIIKPEQDRSTVVIEDDDIVVGINKLYKVEYRAGVQGLGDYEAAIGPNGADAQNTGQIEIDWTQGSVDWNLSWNSSLGEATFSTAGQTISFANPEAVNQNFDAFWLAANAFTNKNVPAGSEVKFEIDTINDFSVDYSIDATASGSAASGLIFADEPVTSMSGTASVSGGTQKGRSALNVNLQGFSISNNSDDEYTTIAALQNIGEFGTVSNLNHNSQTISLDKDYTDPIVFAPSLSYNGSQPGTVRIGDVSNNSFEAYIQEPSNLDGFHTLESFSYLVLEAGTYKLPDGNTIEVGTVETNANRGNKSWETVDFATNFTEAPIVFTQVQTDNESDLVRTRQRNTSANSFELSMEEEEAKTKAREGHISETIGYFAITPGSGSIDNLDYEAGNTSNTVTHQWSDISFEQDFEQTPHFLASVATYDGSDPSGIRYRAIDENQVQVKIEEDTTHDAETKHTTEVVNFLALSGEGALTAIPYDSLTGKNVITGTEGNDLIAATPESDLMTGKEGQDYFIFSTQNDNVDAIADFDVSDDFLAFSAYAFRGELTEGLLNESQLAFGSMATTENHRFVYNPDNGLLSFDEDGNGAISPTTIAMLSPNLDLSSQQFVIVG